MSFTCTNGVRPGDNAPATVLKATLAGEGTVVPGITGALPEEVAPVVLDGSAAQVDITNYSAAVGGTCSLTIDGKVTSLTAQ